MAPQPLDTGPGCLRETVEDVKWDLMSVGHDGKASECGLGGYKEVGRREVRKGTVACRPS